jgi:hypothetical protein
LKSHYKVFIESIDNINTPIAECFMSQSAWKEKQQREQASRQKSRWEFFALLLIGAAVAGGFLLFSANNGTPTVAAGPPASGLSQLVLQSATSTVDRNIPADYETKGKVDDRYTLAQDPESGEFILNDSLGSIGSNNTSVDGDRMKLAKAMVDLEQYAEKNRAKLTSDAYNWLKKVARTGMKLAFGTPGVPAYAQPGIKKEILAELHSISANPEKSFMLTDKYLDLEKALERPESAYLAEGDIDNTNYLSYDPLSPTLYISRLSLAGYPLTSVLAPDILSPTPESLTTTDSPYAYTVYTTPVLTASTLSPTTVAGTSPTLSPTSTTTLSPTLTSSPTLATTALSPTLSTTTATLSPTLSTSTATLSPTLSTTTATLSPTLSTSTATLSPTLSTTSSTLTPTTSTSSVSVADYYDSILGTHLSPSSSTTTTSTTTLSPTATLSPTLASPSYTTTLSPTLTSPTTTLSEPTYTISSPISY